MEGLSSWGEREEELCADAMFRTPTLDEYRVYRQACVNPEDGTWKQEFRDDSIRVCTRYAPNDGRPGAGLKMLLVTSDFPDVPVDCIYACLQDNDYRAVWDKNQMEGHLVEQIGPQCVVWYYACKMPVVANRDFVSLSSWMEFTNGDRMCVSRAVDHSSEPVKKGLVRGQSVLTVNYVTPHPTSAGGSRLLYLSHVALNGSIPNWLMNSACAKLVPNVMRTLGDTARQYGAYAAANHPPGYVAPWRTRAVDWDAPDGQLTAAPVDRTQPAAAVGLDQRSESDLARAPASGVVVPNVAVALQPPPLRLSEPVPETPAMLRLHRAVEAAVQAADRLFLEAGFVPTRPQYLEMVRACLHAAHGA